MNLTSYSCEKYIEILSSKAPVPGGGSVTALVGALGIALGQMVGNLTVGKKKYADVETEIRELLEKAECLQKEFLYLVDEDARVFEPLSKGYRMPQSTAQEQKVKKLALEAASRDACMVSMKIMEKCCEAIDIIEGFTTKGSRIVMSDAGIGILFCKAALQGASLNVFVNTRSMINKEDAEYFNSLAEKIVSIYTSKADTVFEYVNQYLKK